MDLNPASAVLAPDRRVRRTRSALMRAAMALVSARGTTAITISDIADEADVSRQVVYQQFGDRDTLLLDAAKELAQRDLLPRLVDTPATTPESARVLAVAQHFAEHRSFYRAMLTGSCAFDLNRTLAGLLTPVNQHFVAQVYGERLPPQVIEDLAMFLTGGASSLFNAWVVDGPEPLDPEDFTERVMRIVSVVAVLQGDFAPKDREPDR